MSDQSLFEQAEEPWEAHIASLLADLAPVEPPDGFLARAVDHRPRFAGRTVLGLGLGSVVLVASIMAAGGLNRPASRAVGSPTGGDPQAVTIDGDRGSGVFGQAAVGADDFADPLLRPGGVLGRLRDAAATVSAELGFPTLE